jgi:hypothetical protein
MAPSDSISVLSARFALIMKLSGAPFLESKELLRSEDPDKFGRIRQ